MFDGSDIQGQIIINGFSDELVNFVYKSDSRLVNNNISLLVNQGIK